MSGFGPPPGAPSEAGPRRPPSYLPPGGLGRGGTTRPLLVNSHKPGIILLRPMSLGDVVDGAVKHIRRNPGAVLGASLVVLVLGAVPAILLAALASRGSWYADIGADAVVDQTGFFGLVLLFGMWFAAVLLSGTLAYSVGEAALGRKPSLTDLWAATRRRLAPLLALAALLTLALALPAVLVVLLVALAGTSRSVLAVVLVILFGGLSLVAWCALLTTRTSLAASAMVLERRGVLAAFRRSWALTSRAFWRTFTRLAVVGVLSVIVFWVAQLPLLLVTSLVQDFLGLSPTLAAFASSVSLALATLLSAAVVIPFWAGATSLLYVDQRMRREGFDLVLQRAARGAGGRLQ